MALLLVNDILLGHTAEETAEHFVNAGYGNIEQAVREFAEELKEGLPSNVCAISFIEEDMIAHVRDYIDQLIKERFGGEGL